MIVVPESMIVWKPETAVVEPTRALAPEICQNPLADETSWNSMSLLKSELSVPPR